jgi:predicted aspartyl protease
MNRLLTELRSVSLRTAGRILVATLAFHAGETAAVTIQELLTQQGYTAVPARRGAQNHLFVDAKLNDRKLIVMIDTGFGGLGIDPGKAAGLKRLATLPVKLHGIFGPFASELTWVQIDTMKIGPVSYAEEPAALVPLRGKPQTHVSSRIPAPSGPADHDVVLGWEFLSRHHLIIDTRSPALFVRTTEPPEDFANSFGRSLLAGGFTLVPLTFRNLQIEVPATVNGRPALFMLDTGGPVTVLDAGQAASLGVNVREKILEARDIGGKRRALSFTIIGALRIGDFGLANMEVGVTDLKQLNELRAQAGLPTVHGMLGPEVLDRGLGIIDCANLRLYLYGRALPPTKKK